MYVLDYHAYNADRVVLHNVFTETVNLFLCQTKQFL